MTLRVPFSNKIMCVSGSSHLRRSWDSFKLQTTRAVADRLAGWPKRACHCTPPWAGAWVHTGCVNLAELLFLGSSHLLCQINFRRGFRWAGTCTWLHSVSTLRVRVRFSFQLSVSCFCMHPGGGGGCWRQCQIQQKRREPYSTAGTVPKIWMDTTAHILSFRDDSIHCIYYLCNLQVD